MVLTVKPEYLPKTSQEYAKVEVVWSYNHNELVKNRVGGDGELSEITDGDDDDEDDQDMQ